MLDKFGKVANALHRTRSAGQGGRNNRGKDNVILEFIKKNRNLSAFVLSTLITAGLLGGKHIYDQSNENDNTDKIELIEPDQEFQAGTYGEYMARLRPLEPMIIADLIAKEGVRVNAQGLHVPYKCSRGVWTIGFGSTMLKDGTCVTKNTKPITTEEAYELARWHLENETFLVMYWYDVAHDKVNINTTEEAFAIASIMYNAYANLIETPSKKDAKGRYIFQNVNYDERCGLLRQDFAKYGTELPKSVVLERFAEYPITNMESFGRVWLGGESKEKIANMFGNFLAGGNGLRWRRWLEAETYLGHVTPEMMLNCPVGGMYEFFKYVGDDRSNWFLGDAPNRRVNDKTLAKFQEWIHVPRQKSGASLKQWKKSKDWLPPQAREMCENGKCTFGNAETATVFAEVVEEDVKKQTYVTEYKDLYADAIAEFRQENYTVAATKLEAMIKSYPNNALLCNDLAATYNKMGRYDDAIASVRVILDKIGDTEQYGAAYYNAGRAREGLGQKKLALGNYQLAVRHGNRRAQKDVTRLSPPVKSGAKPKAKTLSKKKNSRRVAFNDGAKKIRNNAYSADLIMQKIAENQNS